MTLNQLFLINIGALISAMGGVFLKRLSGTLQDVQSIDSGLIINAVFNKYLWLGGICYVLPILFWAYLLRSMDLTKLQPLLSIVYIYTVGFAYLFLGEQPSLQRLIGIAVVVIGVVLVGRS